MSVASTLGKRKRATVAVEKSSKAASPPPSEDEEDVRSQFQRAFEAKFAPLEVTKRETAAIKQPDGEKEHDNESDWGGFSSEEDEVEVVQVNAAQEEARNEELSNKDKRAFMSSKPPSANATSTAITKKSAGKTVEEDGAETLNLKNDLALQRLLKESHLLDGNASAGPAGKNRLKATELRLQALGAKTSVLEQKNMPLSHRKGIAAKAARVESQRRQEAKENGIVLERVTGPKKSEQGQRRERGIGGPTVGKFRGGMLTLSKKDVSSITSSGKGKGSMGRKKGRRK